MHTVRCDLYVHGPARPSRIPMRSSSNSSLLTYPLYLSYSLHRSNIFCFSFFLPAVHITSTHSSRDHFLRILYIYIFSLSRSHAFQWFPTGLSFYFALPALSSSDIYLLLTKHAALIPYRFLQYLSFIHFCRPTMSVVSLGNFVRCKFRHLHTFLLSSSTIKVSSWSDFSTLLRFLSEVILMFNLLLCLNELYSNKAFLLSSFCTYQGSFSIHSHPLILSSLELHLLFFSLESSPLYLIVLLVSFRSRLVHPVLSITACTAFSVFFQFAWNRFLSRPWSALPSVSFFRPLFFSLAHGLLRRVDARNARPF